MRRLLPLALLLASPAPAQEVITLPPNRPEGLGTAAPGEAAGGPLGPPGTAASATGGVVRVLDKINGTLADLDLALGETVEVGSLSVTLGACRVPADNPAGDAFALVSIRARDGETALFEGWLIASSPALNAMDHPRYDVWALRCTGY